MITKNCFFFHSVACPESVPQIICSKGLFIQGSIEPPLVGVAITVSLADGQKVNVLTNNEGKYRVGPLTAGILHTVV